MKSIIYDKVSKANAKVIFELMENPDAIFKLTPIIKVK